MCLSNANARKCGAGSWYWKMRTAMNPKGIIERDNVVWLGHYAAACFILNDWKLSLAKIMRESRPGNYEKAGQIWALLGSFGHFWVLWAILDSFCDELPGVSMPKREHFEFDFNEIIFVIFSKL